MSNFALELWDDECDRCIFYTIRVDDAEYAETEKFFLRFGVESGEFLESAQILLQLITESIGNKYGAIDDFFDRAKNRASALPPRPKRNVPEIMELGSNFPLRLYCLRINEQLVVLFWRGAERVEDRPGKPGVEFEV